MGNRITGWLVRKSVGHNRGLDWLKSSFTNADISPLLYLAAAQIDMHILGGNATTSVFSACYCLLRSLLSSAILYGVCLGALHAQETSAAGATSASNNAFFSVFCALCVGFSYHLSRSASDPSVLWQIIKRYLFPGKKTRVE